MQSAKGLRFALSACGFGWLLLLDEVVPSNDKARVGRGADFCGQTDSPQSGAGEAAGTASSRI